MKKLVFLAGIALAAPAFAQSTATPSAAPMAAPSTVPAAEAPAPAAETAPATEAADPAAAPATAAAPAPTDPKAILASEFPNYDKDKSGALDKTELTTWLTALQDAQPNKPTLTPEQKTAWLDKSFTDADADKNGSVNLAELQKHLVPAA